MAKINIPLDINECEQCPKSKVEKVYTPDSFENVRKVHCAELQEDVYSYLDWNEKSTVPSRCPLKTN